MDLGLVIPTTGAAVLVTLFAQAPPQITGDWRVSLGTVAAVGIPVLLGTWRIGRWMKKIEDGQAQAKVDRESVYKQLGEDRSEFRDTIKEIFHRLNELPCRNCPPERSKHK